MTNRQTWCAYIGAEQIEAMVGKHRKPEPPQAKLTEESIRQIKRDVETLRKLQAELSVPAWADRLGVSRNAIYKALCGQTWRHVK